MVEPSILMEDDYTSRLAQGGDQRLSVVLNLAQGTVTEVVIAAGSRQGKLLAYRVTGPPSALQRLAVVDEHLPRVLAVADEGGSTSATHITGDVRGIAVGAGQQVTMDFTPAGVGVVSTRPVVRLELVVPQDASVQVYGLRNVTFDQGLDVVIRGA